MDSLLSRWNSSSASLVCLPKMPSTLPPRYPSSCKRACRRRTSSPLSPTASSGVRVGVAVGVMVGSEVGAAVICAVAVTAGVGVEKLGGTGVMAGLLTADEDSSRDMYTKSVLIKSILIHSFQGA